MSRGTRFSRPRFGLFLSAALLAFPTLGTPSTGTPVAESASRVSRELLARVAVSALDGMVDVPDLAGARAEDVFWVHDPSDGHAIYGLVPIRKEGEVIGVIGVDASGEEWQWFTFSYRDKSFPRVPEGEAREKAVERARFLGAADPARTGSLVRGHDKRLYWRFESAGGESWLVDMDRRETAVIGTADGSALPILSARSGFEPGGRAAPRPEGVTLPADDDRAGLERELPAAYNIEGVPYHYQITDWYCGPASLQMMMDYAGEEISQHTIGDVANENSIEGTYDSDLIRAANFSGMSVAIQDSSLEGYAERKLGYGCIRTTAPAVRQLKILVSMDRPVLVLMWYDGSYSGGHFRVVKGYDSNLGVLILHDPWFGAPFWGPDLIMSQTFFLDLWNYSGCSGFATGVWQVVPDAPPSVEEGDTFAVELTVRYPGPSPYNGQYPCSTSVATIELPPGLSLLGGSATRTMPNLATGDSAVVSWDVVASGGPGEYNITFQAQGIVRAYSYSYTSGYADSIGGHALETVVVGPSASEDWENEARLTIAQGSSSTGFPGGRAMAVEPDGTVRVVWADTRDGNSEIYSITREAGVWQAETRLTNDAAFSASPAVACDESGGVHVVWVDSRDGDQEIYYKYKDISGWSADQRVTNRAGPDGSPTIAAGGGGVYVAWEKYDGFGLRFAEVAFSVKTDGSWSTPTAPDASSALESYRPCLAWKGAGPLHLVYEREGSTVERQKIRYRSWNGTSWSSATVLSADSSYARGPVIAVGANSSLHVVWQSGENVPGDVYYAMYDGASWHATEPIVTGPGEAATPTVAVDASGLVWVAWADNRHGEPEIHVQSSDGSGGWSSDVRISGGNGASSLPTLGADGTGEVCGVWTDLRDGNSEIYFRNRYGVDTDVEIVVSSPGAMGPVVLTAPFPSPFRAETRLDFMLPAPAVVALRVFDFAGREVRTLAHGLQGAGIHSVVWDGKNTSGRDVAPGVYFIRCETPHGMEARKIVRIR